MIQDRMAYFENLYAKELNEGLTAERMNEYNADQMTLLAYLIFRREMLEGGLVQLIYNGYGHFLFRNPFAKMMRAWGLKEFSSLVYSASHLYAKYATDLEDKDLDDDEFMALYEQFPEMEEIDDDFIEMESDVSQEIANFVSQNPDKFGFAS